MSNRMAINTAMPAGFNGQVARTSFAVIESKFIKSSAPVASYGCACRLDGDTVAALTGSTTAAQVYGFVVCPQVTASAQYPNAGVDDFEAPDIGQPQGILIKGYLNVKVNAGAAAAGGDVYVRVAAGTSSKPIGGVEAAADGSNTVKLSNATFVGGADEYGVAEIRIM